MHTSGIISAVAAVSLFAGSVGPREAGAGDRWQTYGNARFAFQGCYPENVFLTEAGSENQDGRTFTSPDGAILRMFGRNNALGQSLREAFQEEVERTRDEYGEDRFTSLGRTWFVVSGRNAARVLYEKTVQDGDQFKTLRLEYGVAHRSIYNALVTRMSACFKSLSRR